MMAKLIAIVLLLIATAAATPQRSLYDELSLTYNATTDDVTAAYQRFAKTWDADAKYGPAEILKMIEIEHAYYVLSNKLRRRDYDYFQFDELQRAVDNAKSQYEGRTQSEYVQFPLWEPKKLGDRIKSTAETITSENFGHFVLHSSDTWVIQIYSVASEECHEFAPVWDRTVDLLEGVVKVGRLELGEIGVTRILAERNWLHGYPFFRNGLPAIIAVQPGCQRFDCVNRYYQEKTSEAIADWVATKLLRLPRILYYSAQTLMAEILQKPAPHKVKVIQFSHTGERASLFLRKAAKDYWEYTIFAMVLWRESEATFWESRVGVESGPATVFLKDPGLSPAIYHGKLNSTLFGHLIEKHKMFELPQLRSITATKLGCDVSHYSAAGTETKIWYCVIVAGRPGFALNQFRGVARGVQNELASSEAASSTPGAKAFKDKRLSLSWLDGEKQKDFCFFYLNSETMFEACGPRKYELDDIPKIFLIRYVKVDPVEDTESQKKRWLPKTTWEKQAEEEMKYAAQLVTRYNGSADVPEIVDWISRMVTQGDEEDLPSFRGKAPDLVAEESIPFTAKSQEFVSEKRDKLLEKGKGIFRVVDDFKEDPKFLPLVTFIAIFYSVACFFGARQKQSRRNKGSTKILEGASNSTIDSACDSTTDSTLDERSKVLKPSTSEGLRRRDVQRT